MSMNDLRCPSRPCRGSQVTDHEGFWAQANAMCRRQVLCVLAGALTAGAGGPVDVMAAEPRRIASVGDLGRPWASVEFEYLDGGEIVPGIAIALPNGELYGAALICTHERCPIQYVTDVEAINNTYDVTVSGPALVCPCHLSVFDLERAGAVAGGPAPRSPRRFELTVQGQDIYVTKFEGL